jgi:enoyl-CoA hydratase/carnithine racemase
MRSPSLHESIKAVSQSLNQTPQGPDAGLLSRTDHGRVAHLALASPGNRNALSLQMMGALADQLSAISRDPAVLCVVLSGEGPAFCAGHDLREITAARAAPDGGRALFEETMGRCSSLMQQIAALPQPVIAAVEGVATAAGCQLVATCDLAVAGAAARFCTPGVDIGLFCSTPGVALGRAVAPKHAMEMLLTGDMIGAEDAHRFGLVNRIVPQGQALQAALAWAAQIATKSPQALRMGKATFRRQMACPLPEAYDLASRAMVENLLKADANEGIGAFLDKRAPTWHDFAS